MKSSQGPRLLYDGTIYYSQRRGGISRYFTRLIEHLHALEPSWTFWVHVHQGELAPLPAGERIRIIRQRHFSPRQVFFPVNYALREWHRRRLRPSLYHSSLYRPFRLSGCPIVSTVYDMVEDVLPEHYPDSRARTRLWKRWTVRRAAAILAVSEQTKRDLVRLLGVAPEKVRVTYLAADPVFRPAEEDEGREFAARWGLERPYLLYVGHRGEHKNFRVLAQAFRDQRLAEFMLLLVGGQPEAPELAQFDEATAGRVVHVKSAEDVELRLAYAGAAVFVFPSLYEGFGLPVLEAMSCGAPVAASDIPTTREVYGDACELFAPTDPDGLVQAVLRACQPSRRNELLAAGLARAAQFSWERCASETLETYRSVLGLA